MEWRENHKLAFLVFGMHLSIFSLSGKTIKVARPARSSLSMSSTILSKYSSYDPWITSVLTVFLWAGLQKLITDWDNKRKKERGERKRERVCVVYWYSI